MFHFVHFAEYNFTKDDMDTMDKTILTYHRMIEILKFSHAYRSHLGDPDFVENKAEFKKVNTLLISAEKNLHADHTLS